MTRVAFSCWDDRIAPVCDVARQVRVVDAEAGRAVGESDEMLPEGLSGAGLTRLTELGVTTLVCGAISWPVLERVSARCIDVIPFVAGDLREVVRAWLMGRLKEHACDMPGCGSRRRHRGRVPGGGAMRNRSEGRSGFAGGAGTGAGAGGGTGGGMGRQGRGRGR